MNISDLAALYSKGSSKRADNDNAKMFFDELTNTLQKISEQIEGLKLEKKQSDIIIIAYKKFKLEVKIVDNIIIYLIYPIFANDFVDYYLYCRKNNFSEFCYFKKSIFINQKGTEDFSKEISAQIFSWNYGTEINEYKKQFDQSLDELSFDSSNLNYRSILNNTLSICIKLLSALHENSSITPYSQKFFNLSALKKGYQNKD